MYIRVIASIEILLLCIITVSCSKTSSPDKGKMYESLHAEVYEDLNAELQEGSDAKAQEGFNAEVHEGLNAEAQDSLNAKAQGSGNAKAQGNDNAKAQRSINAGVRDSLHMEENTMIDDMSETVRNGYEDPVIDIASYPAGSLIDTEGLNEDEIDKLFYSVELDSEVKTRINGLSYGEDCTVPYEELRYIRVLHKGFDGKTYVGELIVNREIAEDIAGIFHELYYAGYPIERMVLIDEYNADDILSMEANNSSAFNFRYILGTTKLSRHSLGLAVDVNPLYNPYVAYVDGEEVVLPANGAGHTDRSGDCPYYIRKGDVCYEAFTSRGFTWGGEWNSRKDYQHFEKPGE